MSKAIDKMTTAKLKSFKHGIQGHPLSEFLQHHLDKQTPQEREEGLLGTYQLIPDSLCPQLDGLISQRTNNLDDLLKKDCGVLFDNITNEVAEIARASGVSVEPELLFNSFQLFILTAAQQVEGKPLSRKAGADKAKSNYNFFSDTETPTIGISHLVLLYIIGVLGFKVWGTPITSFEAIGDGMTQLGYVLFVAGLLAGTFRALGLDSRRFVFFWAVLLWVGGVLLINF